MLQCPSCRHRLSRIPTPKGVIYGCRHCGGRSVAVPVLRRDFGAEFTKNFLIVARGSGDVSERRCSFCGRHMSRFTLPTPQGPMELDHCPLCNLVWFDRGELEAIPHVPPPVEEELSPKAREALALYKIQTENEAQAATDTEGPESYWQYIPAFLGLPVEFNDTPRTHLPWLTWTLSAAMAALLAVQMGTGSLEAAIREWGFIPDLWYRHGGMTLLTSFLLHAGIWHAASNLYFFLTFADNVEDHLGASKFLLLLLTAHLAGALLHSVLDPRGQIPLVGASAGISGVLAYYAVTFPRARVGFLWWIFFIPRWFRISIVWALAIYICLQLFGAWMQSKGQSSVSSLGHLGGVAVGLAAGFWARAKARQQAQSTGQPAA